MCQTDILGLPHLGGFSDHAGYDGVFVGLSDARYHLEFTHHQHGSPGPAPSNEHLLVLYLGDDQAVGAAATRLARHGYPAVEPDNPYWVASGAVTVADPDGWRVVLMPSAGLPVDEASSR